MEFGPTDRFDVIELKGFDKDELEREGGICSVHNVLRHLHSHVSRTCGYNIVAL